MKFRHTEKGMALVITLMMLAITTFMAVVFLSLSRRERSNVKTVEAQMNSRMMADMALARMQADLTGRMINDAERELNSANPFFGDPNVQRHIAIANRAVQRALFSYDLRTSKNFLNPNGFRRQDGSSPWNVNYYSEKGQALNLGSDDYYQNVANLQYDPRPPVIVTEGRTNDFRFYIDLNRNGMFDENARQDVTGPKNEKYSRSNNPRETTSGPFLQANFVGDPEWIGVLERPDLPHSETNRFIGRYAYIMLPTGKSLDVNFIHNLSIYSSGNTNLTPNTSRFSRNQGVGSWELNLAGFLVDLHTNVWRTNGYQMGGTNQSSGYVFNDAIGLLQYRLNRSRGNLRTPQDLFGPPITNRWNNDLVDMAGDGPIIPYNKWYGSRPVADFTFAALDNDEQTRFWHGAEHVDRTSEFPDVQRYFKLKSATASTEMLDFHNRFTAAVSSPGKTNTYDRYAYYRMLAQMGADSKPAIDGKIHLNFTNEPGTISSNLVPWVLSSNNVAMPTTLARQFSAALVRRNDGGEEYQLRPNNLTNFFLIAADAMLKASLVTNVYLDNFGNLRTNYTVGSSYFDHPEWNAIPDDGRDPQRRRRIVGTPVRPDISITNIQIFHRLNNATAWRPNDLTYTNNEYSSAVHRILQLAANIYDNMTNDPGRNADRHGRNDPFFPTAWRPLYNITDTNIAIIGWEPQMNASFARNHVLNTNLWRSPMEYFTNRLGASITNVSFYGQPWVVGVKKGWPTFNEFSIETHAQVTRKLEIRKFPGEEGKPLSLTNYAELARRTRQIYMLGLSNTVGIEAWNSYALTNRRNIRIDTRIETRVGIDRVLQRDMTTSNRTVLVSRPILTVPWARVSETTAYTITNWPGRQDLDPKTLAQATPANGPSDFRVPLYDLLPVLENSEYSDVALPGAPFGSFFPRPAVWQSITNTPDFVISITNRVRYLATDVTDGENRILDYVTLDNLVTKVDLDEAMRQSFNAGNLVGGSGFDPALMWNTDPVTKSQATSFGVNFGVAKQIEASLDILRLSDAQWKDYSAFARTDEEIQKFQLFMYGTNSGAMSTNTAVQVPFTPSRLLYLISRYQANDPLVHYTAADLRDRRQTTRPMVLKLTQRAENDELGLRNTKRQAIRNDNRHGIAFQDPRVFTSDNWEFPIAKLDDGSGGAYGIRNFHYRYPNIGTLGQIHRGTPWQTVYLKAAMAPNVDPTTINEATWVDWAGSYGTHPTNDWKLVGLFTTAMSESAARGLLSVNQTNIAAWSAALSGVPVITNSWSNNEYQINRARAPKFGIGTAGDDLLIQPASKQLRDIVNNINLYRSKQPMGVFRYLGEILGTPMLSVGNNPNNGNLQGSPFLNLSDNQIKNVDGGFDWHAMTDEAVEAIPQRILSLLKEDEPRVTVYCFGQTLKPAPRSFITSADHYNLCVNYQVTGEYVTKATVRVEGDLNPTDFMIENPALNYGFDDDERAAIRLQRKPFKTVVESFEVLAPFE